jgi:hypothetical protein
MIDANNALVYIVPQRHKLWKLEFHYNACLAMFILLFAWSCLFLLFRVTTHDIWRKN